MHPLLLCLTGGICGTVSPPLYLLSRLPTLELIFSCVTLYSRWDTMSVQCPPPYLLSPYPQTNLLLCYNRWHTMVEQIRWWSTLRASMFQSHRASTLQISYVSTHALSILPAFIPVNLHDYISTDFIYTCTVI